LGRLSSAGGGFVLVIAQPLLNWCLHQANGFGTIAYCTSHEPHGTLLFCLCLGVFKLWLMLRGQIIIVIWFILLLLFIISSSLIINRM
jgi:hypothetical protein